MTPWTDQPEPRNPAQKLIHATVKVVELFQRLGHLVAAHKAFMVRAEELTLEFWVLLGFFRARLRHAWYSFGGFHVVLMRLGIGER